MDDTDPEDMKTKALFDWTDTSVFALMLIISATIGIYFGCFGSKQKSPAEYLLGGKSMGVLPVALSLVASHISATTLIGVPAEVYTDGTFYILMVPSLFFSCLFTAYFFIPVYCNLNLSSAYEYLELRYNRFLRSYASFLYIIHCFLFVPPILYVPSASLSQVTGLNLHVITSIVAGVCIFYTTIGGLKAVVWTDFFQTIVTIAACLAIIIIGTINLGGFSSVMEKANEGKRLDIFNFDPNPFQRNTFWTVTIGIFFSWTAALGANQSSVQRFISVPTARDAQKVVLGYWFGISFLTAVSIYGGLLVYAAYFGCDPIKRQLVSKADQVFPYYVQDKIGYVPFLPGLFVAGVFSAALSSLSTSLNTLAGTIYVDYIKHTGVSDNKAGIIMKCIIVFIGVLSVALVFVVEKLGNIIPVSFTLSGVTGAPVFALFLLGMMCPFANATGAFVASVTCFGFLAWIAIGSALNSVSHASKNIYLNETCSVVNLTSSAEMSALNGTQSAGDESDDIFFLYKLSYMLYKCVGIIISLIVGIIVSYLTGPTDLKTIDPRLISPPMRIFLPKKSAKEQEQDQLMLELKHLNL